MRARGTILLVTAVAAAAVGACSSPERPVTFPSGEWIDLSHPFDGQTIYWPTADRFHIESVADGVTDAGFYYAANNFSSAEHGGTHIDAPVHFARGQQTVDQIPFDRLIGPAAVVDATQQSAQNADYLVTVDDVQRAEERDGPIPPDAIVLIRTGYSSRWPDAERYLGTAERGEAAVAKLHFPGLHPDAARWLVENRSVKAVGIDTASIDVGQSTQFETHQVLNGRNVPVFENLTALDRLPARGAYVIALPMKIAGGSGGPLRAVALVPGAGSGR
jgi:kynurenine formamidase